MEKSFLQINSNVAELFPETSRRFSVERSVTKV